jgi:molybdopterin adenylyltransferase
VRSAWKVKQNLILPDMQTAEILSVNISREKGTIKNPVSFIELTGNGIAGDAHAGPWHRQISLLGEESIAKAEASIGRRLEYGEFAENITTRGLSLYEMKPLDKLICGDIVMEVTQIGKKCHGNSCAIYKETGDCVMPKEGLFARVIKGGKLKAGDIIEYQPRVLKIKIITLSDRASEGVYEDKSGPFLAQYLQQYFEENGRSVSINREIIPDEADQLKKLVNESVRIADDFLFTTGGTGLGPRDITPDVLKSMFEKEIPGIMEMIRMKYGTQYPNALVSRSVAGLIGNTLVYALPGSPKAVKEYADEILKTVEHSLRMIHKIDFH